MRNKVALITGASSGIGYESAQQLAALGYDLIITARRKEKLEELSLNLYKAYRTKTNSIALDMLKENSVKELTGFVKRLNVKLDLVLNNAGFGDYGAFEEADIQKLEDMVTLNVTRLTQLTYHMLPLMHHEGQICNVGSLASFMPGPYMATYYATKSYVLNLSLALKEELKSSSIHVSTFVPGPVKTEFNQVAKATFGEKSSKSMKMVGSQDVQTAVEALIKGIQKKKSIIYSNKQHGFLVGLIRLVPHTMIGGMMAKIQKQRIEKE